MADGDQQRLADSSASADSSFADTPPDSTVQPCPLPKIYFTRGIILALPETKWSWLQTEVVTPLPGPVVKRLQKYKRQPRDSELVQVCVTNAAATSATISGGAAPVTVDLQAQDGDYLSVKKILCWYGSADGIDPNGWDNIQLVEVTSGDAFVTQITATAQGVSANLGMLDVRVTDPDEGQSRSLRYCLHRSRKPTLKFLTPIVNVDNIKVILDDGDNATPDTVDITSAVQLQGASTDYSAIPDWVDQAPANMTIQQNTDQGRLRAVVASVIEGEQDEGRIALFMNGENRVRLEYTRPDGVKEILYHAHSLHYLDTDKAIANGHFDTDKVDGGDDTITIKKSTLLFDYKDDAPGLQMSSVLHALRFRPQALSPKFKIMEARSEIDLDTDALVSLHDEINGYDDEALETVTIAALHPADPVPLPECTSLIPRALHADYAGAPTRIFNNPNMYWHHFVIHTFPALRMIETQLYPRRRPTVVQVTGFEHDKTFVGPSTIGGVTQLVSVNNDEGDTKIALFGMCEGGYGTPDHRNQLSQRRATSLWELLRHKMGFWFDQFAMGTELVAESTPELEFALMRLGYYAGPISGASNPDLTAACRKFEAAEGLAGPASGWQPTGSARWRMGKRLHESLGATGATTCPDTKWGINEVQYMLVQVGDLTPPYTLGTRDDVTIAAAKSYQQGKSLTQDGVVGLCTRIALMEDYMNSLVPTPLTDDRFYASAQFGCGDSHPADPANPAGNPLDNRVDTVFRKSSIDPIDPAVLGAGVPYGDWVQDLDDSQLPAIPKVLVAVSDTGLGAGENFSGAQSGTANDYQIKGERILRPTNIAGVASGNANMAVVRVDGDLSAVGDGNGHGTAVMTCMAADGVGSQVGGVPRSQNNVVIGVAPHVRIRPIQIGFTVLDQLVTLELMAADPEVIVYSTSVHLYWNSAGPLFVSPKQWRAIEQRTQDLMAQGRIVFASAGNFRYASPPYMANVYDTATRQWGRFATERTTSRSNAAYSGANQYRQSVCIVGSSAEVGASGPPIVINVPNQQDAGAGHTYIGEQVSVHTPGERIRAVMPTAAQLVVNGNLTNQTAAIGLTTIGHISGTSFATPMTAGIAGELMLLDPALRQAANMPRVVEYIEATCDPLPNLNPAGGNGAPANPRSADPGPAAGVPPTGPQLPNQPAAYANIRRVHYWKAVLAALNQGLSAEGRGADGAQDGFFQFCTLRGHANTKFYGFELRSEVPGAFIWLHTWAGHYQLARDPGAMLPGNATIASTWICTSNYQLAPNQPLPNFPWPQASFAGTGLTPQYLCQLSFARPRLDLFDAIEIHLPDNDANRPVAPALLSLPLTDYGALRTPTAQPANTVIQTFVDAFDDFVFHCRDNPKVITALQLFSAKGSTDVAVGEAVDILIYGVDQFGFLVIQMPAAPAPVISHNGTAGQAAPAAGVSLNGAPAPQAGVPFAFGTVPNKPFMAKVPFTGNTAEVVTLTAVDGAGRSGTLTLTVAAAGALATFALTIRQRGGGKLDTNPPHTGDLLEVEVVANDANGLVIADFAGDVTLSVAQGQKGSAAGGKKGLQVKTLDADPFSDAAFTYTYAAADQGRHVFNLIDYTAGTLQLTATSNAVSGTSNAVNVLAGGLVSFQIDAPGNLTTGNHFQVTVTALDANGERIEDFVNTVTLSLNTGTAPATAADGTRSGLFIDSPSHDYELPDAGRFAFDTVGYTAEGILLDATGGGVTTTSAPIAIQAGGALDHFGFEIGGGARAGRTMQLKVIPQDANNQAITSFAGAVTLNVTTGTAYAVGPPNAGVKVETTPGTLGNNHTFVAADNGAFVFPVTPYTEEAVVVTAVSGGVSTAAPVQNVTADVVANFLVVVGAIPAGGPISTVTVTARDQFNNICQSYMGAVTINLNQAGQPPAQAAQYTFTAADAGVHTFNAVPVAAAQRGNNLNVTATDGNTSASVGPLHA